MAISLFQKVKPEMSLKNVARLMYAIGIIFFFATLYQYMSVRSFLEFAESAEARVNPIEVVSTEGEGRSIVSFSPNKGGEINVVFPGRLKPGAKFDVHYNPNLPTTFYIENDPRVAYYTARFLLAGILFVILGLAVGFLGKKWNPIPAS